MELNTSSDEEIFYVNPNNKNFSSGDGNVGGNTKAVDDDYDLTIWDIPSIRVTFIVLHVIVFVVCFVGNLTVILVVTLHWRMRSITNFCLANLAVADLCVAIFCVFQNLYSHMAENWILGKAVCKIYHFINEMSLTASVLILVVISVERYLAIIHPMRCKSWMTLNRLRCTIGSVWGISAVYSLPRLYYTTVISHGYVTDHGEDEHICTPNRQLYNSKLFDGIHMGLLFFFPLLIISYIYTVVGIALWRSSHGQIPVSASSESSSSNSGLSRPGDSSSYQRKRQALTCKDILCCFMTGGSKEHQKMELEPVTRGNGGQDSEFNSPRPPKILNQNEKDSRNSVPIDEPIVVVKFDDKKKGSFSRNQKRTQCTVLLNVTSSEVLNCSQTNSTNTHPGENSYKNYGAYNRGNNDLVNDNDPSFNYDEGIGGIPHLSEEASGNLPNRESQHTSRLRRVRVIRATNYGAKALEARRKIIKMLVVIVANFAICNLPFHSRKIWQNWSSSYDGASNYSLIITQITTIIRYANSAINPLLYAFMSLKFRQSLRDFLGCRLRRSFRSTRTFSVRSTNIVPLSTAM